MLFRSLDASTEHHIQKALEVATKGRTTFIIAHRLATIKNADYILVFDKGKIIESGVFDALIAKNTHFAKLAAGQFINNPNKE